jgi:SAM-dependent methyltransferase
MRSTDTLGTGAATAAGASGLARRCATATCRSCMTTGLLPVLDLGDMALTSRFPTSATAVEARYPLEVAFCPECALMQVVEDVPTEEMFKFDYPYYSSFSQALLDHVRASAESIIASRGLGPESLVIELASNDGYMLKNYVAAGIPALGIDPADGPAEAARKVGVPTMCEFFTSALARKLAGEGELADVVLANNVMAHVPDLNDFVRGIATILKPDGLAVVEIAYVRDLVDHCEFDTIYHEHVCNYSVTSIRTLFARHGLFVNHVERIPIHGGSIRVFAEHANSPKASVLRLLEEERRLGMHEHGYYATFGERVGRLTGHLRSMIESLRAEGQRVAAYAAAAKGVIMVGAAGLDHTTIDFVVDRNVHKHGKFLPGARIPVRPVEALLEEMPAYTLLLAWNFKEEIFRQQAEYRRRGGKFIVPVPWPEIM